MNYELAKQLKDAGFRYKPITITPNKDGNFHSHQQISLSELIEACGEPFYSITKYTDGWKAVGWVDAGDYFGEGSTPEEAVAKLWLELNKK